MSRGSIAGHYDNLRIKGLCIHLLGLVPNPKREWELMRDMEGRGHGGYGPLRFQMYPRKKVTLLAKQVSRGRITGPHDELSIKGLNVHPMGLVPKPEKEWRHIKDMGRRDHSS